MFYENFVRLCAKEHKSPSSVAEEMGFHRSVVTRWSKGGEVRKATLERVALRFGITVEELLKDDTENEKKPTAQGDGLDVDYIEKWIDNDASEEQLKMFIARASSRLVAK